MKLVGFTLAGFLVVILAAVVLWTYVSMFAAYVTAFGGLMLIQFVVHTKLTYDLALENDEIEGSNRRILAISIGAMLLTYISGAVCAIVLIIITLYLASITGWPILVLFPVSLVLATIAYVVASRKI